jgi:hypothetical protein
VIRFALLTLLGAAVFFIQPVSAYDDYVNGYTRPDGVYVNSYYRTNADGYSYNNYSTQGNVNPYTGQPGYQQQTFNTSPQFGNYRQIPTLKVDDPRESLAPYFQRLRDYQY